MSNLEKLFLKGKQKQKRFKFWSVEIAKADRHIINRISGDKYEIAFYFGSRVMVEVSQDNNSTCVYDKSYFEQIIKKALTWKSSGRHCINMKHHEGWESNYRKKIEEYAPNS